AEEAETDEDAEDGEDDGLGHGLSLLRWQPSKLPVERRLTRTGPLSPPRAIAMKHVPESQAQHGTQHVETDVTDAGGAPGQEGLVPLVRRRIERRDSQRQSCVQPVSSAAESLAGHPAQNENESGVLHD